MVLLYFLLAPCETTTYEVDKTAFDATEISVGNLLMNQSFEHPGFGLYYSTTNIKVSIETKLIDLFTFISNVGGNLGLFLGFSIIGGMFFMLDLVVQGIF